ncbi:pilus assembly protein N-terminal domain-containing protein [Hoeflea sp. Naph1]|uniref:pilus assembly protein N-terminal domain-containing protein n=1 Tax=Hoeflea sp. Naph1 TaxID=3388653 RepID=UPI00398FCAA0
MTYPIPVHRRLLFAVCGLTLTAATAFPAGATEDMIRVFMDHARILKLDRTVSKVIIGNAGVADVTIADPQTIVLTGKSYGTTNLVILDQAGDAIVDERILVSVDEANTVRVFKQIERSVYSCSPSCEKHVPTAAAKTP